MSKSLTFDEATKNTLMDVVERFKSTRNEGLGPVFDEVIEAIRRGKIADAYQARYLRDSITLQEGEADKNADILAKIEETFF